MRLFEILTAFLSCVAWSSLTLAQSPALQDFAQKLSANESETTIFVAEEFLTMNREQPTATAVAVRDGKFVSVGSLDAVRTSVGDKARIDRSLEGRVVIAGLIEQHVHPVLAALTMNTKVISIEDWDAIDGFSPAVRDPETYQTRLKQALSEHKNKDQPFITWGYHHYMHGELHRELLNQLAPDFPVIVWHRSTHEFYLNDAALKLTGIDATVIDALPESARNQISLAKGHFFEQGAMALLGKFAPILASPTSFKKGLQFTVDYYHRNGITICCEPGGLPSKTVQKMINEVYSGDSVPFNHYFMADGKTCASAHPKDATAMVRASEEVLGWGSGRALFLPKQVKLFTDGAIFSQLMQMKLPYSDGHHGAWIIDPPVFAYAFQGFWDAGYQIHVHNNGDAGFDVVLGELKKAMERSPRKDHRTVLVHFGFANPEQVEAWIKLGGIVSSNPYYVTALAGPYAKIGLGPDRSKNIAPHADVLRHNGSLSFHSDMPMAPAKPFELIWAAVNRLTYEGEVAGAEHKVPIEVALRAMTIDAAFSIQMEDRIGSIEVGKDANLTVLQQHPLRVDPLKLKDMAIWGTMLEGRLQPVASARSGQQSSRKRDQRPLVVANHESSPAAQIRSLDPKSTELSEIREQNRRYWTNMSPDQNRAAYFSATSTQASQPTSGPCITGCSCSLAHRLGMLIEQQSLPRPPF
jgi:predicted amidohydrolase YtcJ